MLSMFGFCSFSSIYGFMDFCTLCTWFVFVLDVYFLYTQVTPLFFLIYSYYLSKKKNYDQMKHMVQSKYIQRVKTKKHKNSKLSLFMSFDTHTHTLCVCGWVIQHLKHGVFTFYNKSMVPSFPSSN